MWNLLIYRLLHRYQVPQVLFLQEISPEVPIGLNCCLVFDQYVETGLGKGSSPNLVLSINPFVPNAPFLYPPENIRKPCGFLCFQGVEKWCIGNEWVKQN